MDLAYGPVTLVFTDIEGSTRLLRRVHDAYVELLAEHHAILDRWFSAEGARRLSAEAREAHSCLPGGAMNPLPQSRR